MGNASYERTPAGFFDQMNRRIRLLERRLPNHPVDLSLAIQAGDGIDITGAGTEADPLIVAAEAPDPLLFRGQVAGQKFASGQVTVGVSIATGTGVNVAVTFPVGYFTSAPKVWAIFYNGRPTMSIQNASPPDTTGATFRLDNWSGASVAAGVLLDWFAIGVGP